MRFGVAFPSYIDIYKEARELETIGFDSCWLYDSPMVYSDVYATLALAAFQTSRIMLGTAVSVAQNRIAPVTAHSIATINELAPGRTSLGFATGNTARRVMGMPPVTMGEFRRECETIRDLLRGGVATYHEGARSSKVRLVHQADGFIRLNPRIPFYVGATGPKTTALAGEVGDGLIASAAIGMELKQSIDNARAARAAAGITEPFKVVAMLGAYVTAPGEAPDSSDAREALGPMILAFLRYALDNFRGARSEMPEYLAAFAAEVDKIPEPRHLQLYDRYFIGIPERFARFVNAETIAAMTVSGPPDLVRQKAEETFRAGADEIVLWPLSNGRAIDNFRRFHETVLKKMR
ncbi:MAG TPA: LLM class flavin-dependent oxidoreductase [Candidatus Binataceae bacterium]|nr:LLM class flavin-dependent oxidoreductase [Candidatus Binataceae bacterium]